MAAQRFVTRVASLERLGVFLNYRAVADSPTFHRYNLIYGFNGSGKTTLSRVFASLEAGSVRPELPEGGTFEIELSDGTSIRSASTLDTLNGQLLVFNVDFIDENLRWKEGIANPVFYLGKAQAELAGKLDKVETKITEIQPKRHEATGEEARKQKAFADRKRDDARLISEQLGLGRKYEAPHLVSDYAKNSYSEELKLSETERQRLRAIITQEAPLAKRAQVSAAMFRIAALVRDVRATLDATLGEMALEDLRAHQEMLKWVKDGFDYHHEHDLASCLFCGNDLTDDRMSALRQAIDDRFDELSSSIVTAKGQAEEFRDQTASVQALMPSVNDIAKGLQPRAAVILEKLQALFEEGTRVAGAVVALLEKKAAAPNIRVDTSGLITDADAAAWDAAVEGLLSDLDAVIAEHNRSHDEFSQEQETARKRLKEHFLADGQPLYRDLEADAKAAGEAVEKLKEILGALVEEAERLRQEMRQHGPAADMINRLIHGYLGHKELEIATLDTGYQIRRNSKPVTGSLSEGEKTAIALCYFLSTLEAEGRQPKNLIVVVDDPISSLDTKALNYAFNLIKGALSSVGQSFIMTHNLHFMNEVKKWLKRKAGGDDPTATLLFLDSVLDAGGDTRSSSLKVMPKLIREYESEYQYLFHLVLQFVSSPDGHAGYFYLMPNALRKVLEIFLAFKLPGSDGLSSKVGTVAGGDYDLDPARVHALDRLVQLESHADNLDDLVTFSSMTIEETKDAADALLSLIRAMDGEHFSRMRRICT